jgi:hypothetical protein
VGGLGDLECGVLEVEVGRLEGLKEVGAEVDGDATVETDAKLDPSFLKGTEAFGLVELQDVVVQAQRVVRADHAFGTQRQHALEVPLRDRHEGRFFERGSNDESPTERRKKAGMQISVRRFVGGHRGSLQLLREASLQGSPKAFTAAPSLRAVGADELDSEVIADPFHLGLSR